MISFRQFEYAYEGQILGKIDEGAIGSLKNFLGRLFGGKVSKLDEILKKYREHEADYWKEWSDNNFQYNAANLIYSQAHSPIEKGKQKEIMERVKRTSEVLETARTEYKSALEKQASLLTGTNTRLKDYYDMKKAEADAAIAQDSYEGAKKMSDEKVIDTLYSNLDNVLKKVKEQDAAFKDKYGDSYRENYFGLGDSDLGAGHAYLGHRELSATHDGSLTIDTYINMNNHTFSILVSKMDANKVKDIRDELEEELGEVKTQINALHSKAETKLGSLAADKQNASWKQEKDRSDIDYYELDRRKKKIISTLSVLMGSHKNT
jgi:hypothetical protein